VKHSIVFAFVCALGAAVACGGSQIGSGPNDSEVKIVGGEAARRGDFPSVVKLILDPGTETVHPKICTGIIINHRTVLAAAHCVQTKKTDQKVSYARISVEASATREKQEILAQRIVTFSDGISQEKIMTHSVALDLAVVDFGPKTFALAKYPKISRSLPTLGDQVTLVGFGATTFDEDNDQTIGELNTGTNSVRKYNSQDGYIQLTGTLRDDGSPTGALAGPGDSGGPLFDSKGNIIGIGSGFNVEGNTVNNYYVDLTSEEAISLISRYLQEIGPTNDDLIPDFKAAAPASSNPVAPRSSVGSTEITTMCGGGKKKNKKKKRKFKGGKSNDKSADPSGGNGDFDFDFDFDANGNEDEGGDVIAEGTISVIKFMP
jgi:V8-like Glu-specific endopeptidase